MSIVSYVREYESSSSSCDDRALGCCCGCFNHITIGCDMFSASVYVCMFGVSYVFYAVCGVYVCMRCVVGVCVCMCPCGSVRFGSVLVCCLTTHGHTPTTKQLWNHYIHI